MKTALVHDDLVQRGGAERVVAALHDIFPEAPLYTSVYDRRTAPPCFRGMDVRTSFLQKWLGGSGLLHKFALPYFPRAFEQFDFSDYDLVVSSCSRFAKGILTAPATCHVCYCHTPSRFAWRPHEYLAQSRSGRAFEPAIRGTLSQLRTWDVMSAQRVDYFIANSQTTAHRIRKYYRREVAAVVPPPVETARFEPVGADQVGDHFLVVSRLVGYKRVDLAVSACNQLGVRLRVIGAGPELASLKKRAGPTVEFLGALPDAEVAAQYARCRALIFPGEEDFGLTPLEAMASGRPVVAYRAGGALETVVAGQTGLFFSEQTPELLASVLRSVSDYPFVPAALQAHASRFDVSVFNQRVREVVASVYQEHACSFGLSAERGRVFQNKCDYLLGHSTSPQPGHGTGLQPGGDHAPSMPAVSPVIHSPSEVRVSVDH